MRRGFKYFFFLISFLLMTPLIAIVRIEGLAKGREGFLNFFGASLSLVPGIIGSFLRRGFYVGTLKRCSWECSVGFGSFFAHREAVVGRNVCIGAYSIIGCARIANNVLIASRVSVTSGKRQHLKNGSVNSDEVHLEEVGIGENSWIGEGAIVMASIGRDCIVSAGSVVTKAAPDEVIIVGNPGRFINRADFHKSTR